MVTDKQLDRSAPQFRLHLVFGAAIVLQVMCWILTSYEKSIFDLEQSFESAILIVATVFTAFFVAPLLVCFFASLRPADLGLCLGETKFGITGLLIALPLISVGLYFGCDDPEIKEFYPWPGIRLADSTSNMLIWFAIYFFYYFAFEFFYRGFLLRGLESELGLSTAIWIQLGMSVMIHFGKPTPELIASIPAGFLFAWFAIKSRSLIYVVILHWWIGIGNDIFSMYHKGWLDQ